MDLPELSSSDDITNILNADEILSSDNEKLRDFYKRLVETDAEIKRVKQNLQSSYLKIRNDKQELERIKRSLNKSQDDVVKPGLRPEKQHLNISNKARDKRLSNSSDDMYGIVIKEQEIIVYEPSRRKNSKNIAHNKDGKLFNKHNSKPFYKHNPKIDNSVKQKSFGLAEDSNYSNNIETKTVEYDNDKAKIKTQKDQINKSSDSSNIRNFTSVDNLDVLKNITTVKNDHIYRHPVNSLRRRRFYLREKLRIKGTTTIPISENYYALKIRKGRSLKSLEEVKKIKKRDGGEVQENENNASYLNYYNFRHKSRRLFEYDTGNTNVKDFVTTSTLDTLNNYTYFNKEAATRELDYNILPEISSVDDFKENKENKIVDINKKNKDLVSFNTYFTKSINNKSEVKREVDNKLAPWDKLYDDEYGVHLDYLNKKIRRDEHEKNKKQKSKNWIKVRLHKLMDRRKKYRKIKKNPYNGLTTKAMNVEESFRSLPSQRKSRTLEFDDDKDMGNIFKKLNAKMESVCREAAYAIQNTRNIKVRESKADITTSTLMQRLVRMMRDLVDLQVQERTCVELPQDLRQFLEWLIPPTKENPQADNLNPDISDYLAAKKEYGGGIDTRKSSDVTPALSFEDTDQAEVDKIQCMETIRAVQDLVDQYEGLSNEDKTRLSGVKNYLQRQLQYLNKLAGDIDIENYNFYRDPEDRFKRETNKIKHKRKFAKRIKKNRFGELMHRFKEQYSKVTTQVTDKLSLTNSNFTVKDKEISFTSQLQKNLNEVYNKALEEAKRITTEDINITIT